VSTISARRDQIVASLRDKEYRDIFVEEEISTGLAFQIRRMREARGWSQGTLAERIETTQAGISRLENPNYGRFSLSTLKRLASAFDVALIVRFAPFSALADWVASLSAEDMEVPDFEHDPGLERQSAPVQGRYEPSGGTAALGGRGEFADTTRRVAAIGGGGTADYAPPKWSRFPAAPTTMSIAAQYTPGSAGLSPNSTVRRGVR
jgi:transcriptional regulator with XRE-family HTH domain